MQSGFALHIYGKWLIRRHFFQQDRPTFWDIYIWEKITLYFTHANIKEFSCHRLLRNLMPTIWLSVYRSVIRLEICKWLDYVCANLKHINMARTMNGVLRFVTLWKEVYIFCIFVEIRIFMSDMSERFVQTSFYKLYIYKTKINIWNVIPK